MQETLLRAWKARDRYDPARASVRTWLYRIATNVCLTALESRGRRPLPSGLGAPSRDTEAPLRRRWTSRGWSRSRTPASSVEARGRPAAGPGRRGAGAARAAAGRAGAARGARLLRRRGRRTARRPGSPAVNSALQRARAALAGVGGPGEVARRDDPDAQSHRAIHHAFEAADVPGLVRLLTDDAIIEMPPVPLWYRGRVTRPVHGPGLPAEGGWRRSNTSRPTDSPRSPRTPEPMAVIICIRPGLSVVAGKVAAQRGVRGSGVLEIFGLPARSFPPGCRRYVPVRHRPRGTRHDHQPCHPCHPRPFPRLLGAA